MRKERYSLLIACGVTNSFYHGVNTGKECGEYYDIDKALSNEETAVNITAWYVDNINEISRKTKIDALAFIEREDGPVGALPLMKLISSQTKIPSFIVRPRKRIHSSAIKGINKIHGKNIAIISDVATSGFSIENVANLLTNFKSNVVAAITVVNRGGENVKDHFKNKNILFRYVDDLC